MEPNTAAGVNNLNPFSLDEVKPKTNMAAGVNNLDPLSLDTKTNMAAVRNF